MKRKKDQKADLEKLRIIYFQIGTIVSLSLILVAFEWNSFSYKTLENQNLPKDVFMESDIVITKRENTEKVKIPNLKTIINIVPDDVYIDEPDFFIPEIEPDEAFTLYEGKLEKDEPVEKPIDFVVIEEKPLFKNGNPDVTFTKFIYENITYPVEAVHNGIQGTVVIEFIIRKTGRVSDIKILNSVHPALDKEAIRVIGLSPLWIPGKQREKPTDVIFRCPIHFKLK